MTVVDKRDSSGFRLRGLQMTRIETFTDAAFAFALTLLVISLDPPTSMAELHDALLAVPAFLLSASMLMMFWWAHHVWSRRYGLDDGTTVVLSAVLVCTVLVYVYPLRFMFNMMMAWVGGMAGWPLSAGVSIADAGDVNRMFVVYGSGFVAMSAAILLLNVHAWRQRAALELDTIERHETCAMIGAWAILLAVGSVSIIVALVTEPSLIGLPGWVYATLGVVMPYYGWAMNRRRQALPADAADGLTAPASHAVG